MSDRRRSMEVFLSWKPRTLRPFRTVRDREISGSIACAAAPCFLALMWGEVGRNIEAFAYFGDVCPPSEIWKDALQYPWFNRIIKIVINYIMSKKCMVGLMAGLIWTSKLNSWLRLFRFNFIHNRFDSCALANLHWWHLKVGRTWYYSKWLCFLVWTTVSSPIKLCTSFSTSISFIQPRTSHFFHHQLPHFCYIISHTSRGIDLWNFCVDIQSSNS